MTDYTKTGHTCHIGPGCMGCVQGAIENAVDPLRSRLQALEQNTVPAGSAKQEPRDWHLLRMLPDGPVLQAFWDQPVAQRAKELFEGAAAPRYEIIRVREVLDD